MITFNRYEHRPDEVLTHNEYWSKLEDYWYRMRPHNVEKDWEELNPYEVEQVKRDYELEQDMIWKYSVHSDEYLYMTGGL